MAINPISALRRAALITSGCLALATSANGFSLQVSAGSLTDAAGQDLSAGSLVIVVVDLNNDGVEHPNATSFTPGADDFILGNFATQSLGTSGTFASNQIVRNDIALGTSLFTDGPTIDPNDPVALFWFPDITNESYLGDSNLAPGETDFGAYNTSDSALNSDWKIPGGDADTIDLQALTTDIVGSSGIPQGQLQIQFNSAGAVVPEPSSALLAMLGSSLLLLRRRRA